MTWKPIIVQLPMAGPQTIHGPYAALIALLIDWPERRSAHHRAAKMCSAALDSKCLESEAREAFQAAVMQAGIGVPLKSRVGAKRARHSKLVSG
ncbi:DUF982 domain-containing protein [Pararhizobium sp. DWP3-4]|uniref:DUF982 domain-containing protein n=1 Tax=Pararhizobium sp. DWP3-4 TaxID=2804565 RepID=UPI003CF69005